MDYPYPMPNSRELILVRHGQSTANARGTWQGQMDFPLSDEGRKQAGMAGLALSRETFDGLYSSPLSRAFETASIIRARTGFRGEVIRVEGLSE
jgi:broad specificity phosphatase PhoE